MQIDNKISKIFSGSFQFLAYTFLIGFFFLALNKLWFASGINLLIACYIFFSYSGVEINTNTREYRIYNYHFHIFKSGKWKTINKFRGITLVPVKEVQAIYSRSNRRNAVVEKTFQVYLVNQSKKPAIAIKKCKTPDEGQRSLDEFAIWLKMPVYSVKR